jgi:hypothetical protein
LTRFAVLGLGAVAILAIPAFGTPKIRRPGNPCISTTNTGAERFASCSEVIDGKTTARLESLEGVGHLPEMEASDKVNALIRDFFLQ